MVFKTKILKVNSFEGVFLILIDAEKQSGFQDYHIVNKIKEVISRGEKGKRRDNEFVCLVLLLFILEATKCKISFCFEQIC